MYTCVVRQFEADGPHLNLVFGMYDPGVRFLKPGIAANACGAGLDEVRNSLEQCVLQSSTPRLSPKLFIATNPDSRFATGAPSTIAQSGSEFLTRLPNNFRAITGRTARPKGKFISVASVVRNCRHLNRPGHTMRIRELSRRGKAWWAKLIQPRCPQMRGTAAAKCETAARPLPSMS